MKKETVKRNSTSKQQKTFFENKINYTCTLYIGVAPHDAISVLRGVSKPIERQCPDMTLFDTLHAYDDLGPKSQNVRWVSTVFPHKTVPTMTYVPSVDYINTRLLLWI